MREVEIAVGGSRTSASVHGKGPTAVVLGHGAGSDRRQPALVRLAEVIASGGRRVLLFNFPYREAGKRLPDRGEVLEATVAAAAAVALAELAAERLVLGGRSMGGRIASQAVASGLEADGLLFLAYPLHPPGRPERLRDRHLAGVRCPMLFVQGTRDAFARWDLLAAVLGRLGSLATLSSVAEGDHAFAVPKRAGARPEDVEAAIHASVLDWLTRCGL